MNIWQHFAHIGQKGRVINVDARIHYIQEDYAVLTETVRQNGIITMSTPFDEKSLELIQELDIEVIKVASCSAKDWPLLENICEYNKPVTFSTGGLTLKEIDDVVSFFDHRRVYYAIMHCISIYPTPLEGFQLNQIQSLRRRYPEKVIGFSIHENPDSLITVQVAVAKGAEILERHIGIETEDIKLNAYSSTPDQIDRWMKAALEAKIVCGENERPAPSESELRSLESLKRGVYACVPLKSGSSLRPEDVYFAMPCNEDQLNSGEFKSGTILSKNIGKDDALRKSMLEIPRDVRKEVLYNAIHLVKGMLNEARIALNTEFEVEFSHHFSIQEFMNVGATFITCINLEYCKKLIHQLPGQRHPAHFHKQKEETFKVLYGTREIEVEDRRRSLLPGDIQIIQQGVWHEFWTNSGVIFEEVSTTHLNDDSFYEDKLINQMDSAERKTHVNQWGRYQI